MSGVQASTRFPLKVATSLLGVAALVGTSCSAAVAQSSDGGRPAVARPAARAVAAVAAVPGRDVRTYHGNNRRTGLEPARPLGRLARAWTHTLDGAVYAQPLVLTVGRVRTVVVATEGNVVYGLNPTTGAVRWRTPRLGTPVVASQLPCGNIDPLGITGTPVYDAHSHAVWVVAEISDSRRRIHHQLVAISPVNGRIIVRRNADPPGQDPTTEQERGALLAANGTIYVPYGGLSGDCGAYHGYVVGLRTKDGHRTVFQTPSAREAGIWTPPGPVADAAGHLYVEVGNGASTSGRWDRSDSVLELSAGLKLIGAFAPASWASDNAADLDLGSTAPTLLANGVVYADGKSPYAYTMRAGHLGGVGSELSRKGICASYGGTATIGAVVYVPCSDGLRAVSVAKTGRMTVLWHATESAAGSPVISGNLVATTDQADGRLLILNRTTGRIRASIAIGATTRFATPALSGNQVFVGTTTGIVAVNGV